MSDEKFYSDFIIDGRFYRTKSQPDEDSFFELTKTSGNTYEIDIYKPAYRKILANPSFLDGCNTQIVGYNIVKVIERGIATRDEGTGKFIVQKAPVVHLLDHEMENAPKTTNAEKIDAYNKGSEMLEYEIAKLENEIREKQKLLAQKRAQLEQMGNQNT